jgi:hypothetical protein
MKPAGSIDFDPKLKTAVILHGHVAGRGLGRRLVIAHLGCIPPVRGKNGYEYGWQIEGVVSDHPSIPTMPCLFCKED